MSEEWTRSSDRNAIRLQRRHGLSHLCHHVCVIFNFGKDVVVVCWGEFGRTPTINKDAGRDHWPRVSCGLLACGGLKHGQVIGATDRLGGEASERPVTFGEVHATLYHALGIDPNTTTVNDLNGRPHYLVENNSQPLHEVV